MKSFLLLTFLVTNFAGFCQQNCLVTRVVDGDTYKVLINGKVQKVQLLNIDAPEIRQYFGIEAMEYVTALIEGRMVEVTWYDLDFYDRMLVSIRVNGMSLDSLLIAKGWAVYDYKYSRDNHLSVYEADAKIKRIRLWQCANTIPPWVWRQLSKQDIRLYQVCRPLTGSSKRKV